MNRQNNRTRRNKKVRKTIKKQHGGNNGVGILMGRFQPFHKAHLASVLTGLESEKIFIVGVGQDGINEKNPYTVEERMDHIIGSVKEAKPKLLHKLRVIVLPESPTDNNWSGWDKQINVLLKDLMNKYKPLHLYLYASGKDKTTADYLKKIVDQNPGLKAKAIEPVAMEGEIIGATTIRGILNEFYKTTPLNYESLEKKLEPYLPNYMIKSIIKNIKKTANNK
jgi:hypothetical protein